ncbi:30S ribosomal protein S6 [Thermodesulfobacteriota bacterium]
MTMRGYETVVIARADMKDDSLEDFRKKLLQIIEREGGILRGIEDWGKKRLAYEIRRHRKGNYLLFNYAGEEGLTTELERNLKIDERSLKYMTIRIEDSLDEEAVEAAKQQQDELMKKLAAEAEKKAESAAAPTAKIAIPAVPETGASEEGPGDEGEEKAAPAEAVEAEGVEAGETVEGESGELEPEMGEGNAAAEEETTGEVDSDESDPEIEEAAEEEVTEEEQEAGEVDSDEPEPEADAVKEEDK